MINESYCAIIGAYGKPPHSFYDMVDELISRDVDVFIIYSGSEEYYHFNYKLIRTKKVENYDIGYNFNVKISLVISNGFNLFTLLTDDVIILNNYDIINYYNNNCKENDILSLALTSESDASQAFVDDSGMTFSDFMGRNDF